MRLSTASIRSTPPPPPHLPPPPLVLYFMIKTVIVALHCTGEDREPKNTLAKPNPKLKPTVLLKVLSSLYVHELSESSCGAFHLPGPGIVTAIVEERVRKAAAHWCGRGRAIFCSGRAQVRAKDYDLASSLERELAAFLRQNGMNFEDEATK